jgi:predicted AAA+ superfamily ATPase
MMKGISETVAGRVAILNLLGFSRRERHKLNLGAAPFLPTDTALLERADGSVNSSLKSLYKDIWLGSFPALIAGPVRDRDLFYSSYLQTYLQRDVRELAQVGNEVAFVRFLRACAARTGQMLNLTDLARDADVAVNTAKNWLSILHASFQIFLLQPYHTNLTKRLVKTPKLYFLDTGLCAYLTEWSSPETLAAGAMSGAILETYALSELLKSWWHQGKKPQIYYYRDKDLREIDFLLVQDQALYPLEVKKSASPKKEWIGHFSALSKLKLNIGKGGVLCLCKQMMPLNEAANAIPIGLI